MKLVIFKNNVFIGPNKNILKLKQYGECSSSRKVKDCRECCFLPICLKVRYSIVHEKALLRNVKI